MGILKPVLILVILSSALLCNNAWATEPPPRVGSVPDRPASVPKPADQAAEQAADKKSARKPAKKPARQPAAKPNKRRSVQQIIAPTPPPLPPVYSPRLNLPPPPAAQPLPAPQVLNGCNGGACTDANGQQYHGGVGTTLLSPQGRVCSNNGITVQCF
jgi:hypothetical protein